MQPDLVDNNSEMNEDDYAPLLCEFEIEVKCSGDSLTDSEQQESDSESCHVDEVSEPSTDVNPFSCSICKASFPRFRDLSTHKKTCRFWTHAPVHMIGLLQCEICQKCFKLYPEYAAHCETHTVKKELHVGIYKCDKCSRTYRHKRNLNHHLKVHEGDPPYKCDQCKKGFALISNLIKHLVRIHRDKIKHKDITCPICRKYIQGKEISSHILRHEEEKRFKCEICNKSFKRESNCEQHKLNHRKRKCTICNKTFKYRALLIKHEKTHIGTTNNI